MQRYHTQQRKLLLAFFAKQADKQFTIDDLERSVEGVSISAIYRNINQMVEDGIVRRFQKESGRKFLYQYIGGRACAQHLHLTCSGCGAILHMDQETSEMLIEAVSKSTDFKLDQSKTMLFGYCASCK